MARVTNKDKFGNKIDAETMLRKFKKAVEKDEILADVKKHEFFIPKRLKLEEKRKKHRILMNRLNKGKK